MSSIPSVILTPSRRTQILVARHAHVHNPQDILYGRLPGFALSEQGRRQAHQLALFLSTRPVSALYSSPLLRARQTASQISRALRGMRPRMSVDLLEVKTGYQGSPNSILTPGFSFFEPVHQQGDETMQDVWARMAHFLNRVARRHSGETIVAVSHADPVTIMRVGLLNRPMTATELHAAVYPARASVNQITLFPNGDMRLAYFNVAGEAV